MPFGEVFSELRSKRRIAMSEFGFSASYIHGIEKNGALPARERLEEIKSHFGKVALEQGSENGEIECKQLEYAWLEDRFVQLGVSTDIAPVLAQIATMEADRQETIIQAVDSV